MKDMKLIVRTGMLLSFCFLLSYPADAQKMLERIANKAKEKAGNVLERKTEEKVDEKIDQTFDKAEEAVSKKTEDSTSGKSAENQQQRMQGVLKGLGMSGEPVPVADSYTFPVKIQMHLESWNGQGKKESDGDFITYLSPGDANFAYEAISGDVGQKGKGIFILDFKNKASIMLSEEEGKKTGVVFGLSSLLNGELPKEETQPADGSATTSPLLNPHLTKTGRSKKILGYHCEEYHYDNPEENSEGNFWITNELEVKTGDFMGTLFKTASFSSGIGWGYLMESEAIDKKTKERSLMQVTDINTKINKNFNLKQYQITNMGSVNLPSGQ